MDDLPGAREALELTAPNDNGYPPVVEAIATHYQVATNRIVTATGCSGANFITAAALLSAGDDVLIERPLRSAHRRVPADGRDITSLRASPRQRIRST